MPGRRPALALIAEHGAAAAEGLLLNWRLPSGSRPASVYKPFSDG
jgi:hypothetical protein